MLDSQNPDKLFEKPSEWVDKKLEKFRREKKLRKKGYRLITDFFKPKRKEESWEISAEEAWAVTKFQNLRLTHILL